MVYNSNIGIFKFLKIYYIGLRLYLIGLDKGLVKKVIYYAKRYEGLYDLMELWLKDTNLIEKEETLKDIKYITEKVCSRNNERIVKDGI